MIEENNYTKTKKGIVERLYNQGHITFDELYTLLIQDQFYLPQITHYQGLDKYSTAISDISSLGPITTTFTSSSKNKL